MRFTLQFDRKFGLATSPGVGWRACRGLALGVLLLGAQASDARSQGLTDFRAPNPLENAYVGLAAQLRDPALCQRISANALHRVRKPTLARSRCFYYLAINTGDLEWCEEVQPIPANVGVMNWLDPERCRFQAARLSTTDRTFPVAFDHELLLREMGYGEADIPERFMGDDRVDWQAYFDMLASRDDAAAHADFHSSLERLPDFSKADRAQDQHLYYTQDEEERELDWVTSRAQRLCIYGRVGANCGEQLARLRPDMTRIVTADERTSGQPEADGAAAAPVGGGADNTAMSAFREASEREKAVYDMAMRLQNADLCRLISDDVIVIGWSLEPGFLSLSLKSACLASIAATSQSDAVCDGVVPIEREDLDGYGQTPAFCRRAIKGWEEAVSRTTLKPDWETVLMDLGYAAADIPETVAPGQDQPLRWAAFADHLADTNERAHAEFLSRLEQAADSKDVLQRLVFTEADLRRHLYQLSVIRFHCSINRFGDRYLFNGYEVKPPQKFGGPFALLDHTGRAVTEKDFRGRYLLVYFGYTYCPDVCPTNLTAISEALRLLGDDARHVQPLFVSVDPERDTPELLANYLGYFHPRLLGLTGTAAQIRRAAKNYQAYYFAGEVDGDYVVDHTSWTYFVGPDGHPLTHFDHGAAPEFMAREMGARIGQRNQHAESAN